MDEFELLAILRRETRPTIGERIRFTVNAILYALAIRRPLSLPDLKALGLDGSSSYGAIRRALDSRSATRLGLPEGLPSRAYEIGDVLNLLRLQREIREHEEELARLVATSEVEDAARKAEAQAIAADIGATTTLRTSS